MPLIGSVQTAAPIAYEALYEDSRTRLTQQAFLLTGHRHRAEQCVRRAFQFAWNRWDEVAADPSPEGWIRAAAFGLALSPWHPAVLRRPNHGGDLGGGDQQLLAALLRLPRAQRRAVVLHDAVGLTWEQTSLEIESSTPAAYGRVVRGRLALARMVPQVTGPDAREPGFGRRLGPLLQGLAVRGCPERGAGPAPDRVRRGARLREHGVNAVAGLATAGVLGGVVTGLLVGTPWHPPTPAFVTRTPGRPAQAVGLGGDLGRGAGAAGAGAAAGAGGAAGTVAGTGGTGSATGAGSSGAAGGAAGTAGGTSGSATGAGGSGPAAGAGRAGSSGGAKTAGGAGGAPARAAGGAGAGSTGARAEAGTAAEHGPGSTDAEAQAGAATVPTALRPPTAHAPLRTPALVPALPGVATPPSPLTAAGGTGTGTGAGTEAGTQPAAGALPAGFCGAFAALCPDQP